MSMISAQIDELRERAKVLRQGRWSDGADDARLMEYAADTIWQLRDDLQQAHKRLADAEHDESRAWDRVRKAEAENAKLRELVSWMYDRMDESCAVQYPYAPAPISYDRLMQALARARELGVEVDE